MVLQVDKVFSLLCLKIKTLLENLPPRPLLDCLPQVSSRIRKLSYMHYINGSEGLLELAHMLHHNTTLTTLDVFSFKTNAANQDSLQAILDGVQANPSLTCVDLPRELTRAQCIMLRDSLQHNIRALLDNANADPFLTPVHLPEGLSVA